ncbi:DUF1489 domain-containing protein [Methyloligella sp. 2.7D]|uniref:DUF1489 family protein n=1 Tax=unclassified Methyloligella TaxID=2625955 RepID=UPI00157CF1DA|nr:DUF1489 domain-containing protein [Methyloligella sp. GL2]QKP77408.1 DUF1489 domain-containing protein [Methyloligella sp. GL2]
MTVHLLKLCVGVDTLSDLRDWQKGRLALRRKEGRPQEICHITRQTPKRRDAVLDGGSLYWVIKGVIQARQPILDLRPETREDGKAACAIVLSPELIPVRPRPRRAFQGWRYLDSADAPPDARGPADSDLPLEMAGELRELGLIDV